MTVTLTVNGEAVIVQEGMTVLEAADAAGIYIPRLCHHPSLGSSHGHEPVPKIMREDGEFFNDGSGPDGGFPGCRLCLVEIKDREGLFTACDTFVEDGMVIASETPDVIGQRKDNLAALLKDHPHACLLCAQQEGCSRTQCSTNVPEDERCCPLLGRCELQKVSGYIGVKETLTKYNFKNLPRHETEALFNRDYNLCISCLRCVRACDDLRGVGTLGYVFVEGKAIVGPTKSAVFADSDCRFCGACAEVCPTGAITDKDLEKGEREDVLVPCISKCPASVDIPRYIHHISQGDYSKANAVVMERVPFPTILGMVCFHPCENACRRGEINEAMAICDLKRFAAENSTQAVVNPLPPSGKSVAIIGSGPTGLSAAYYLGLLGHKVTVFESEANVGGMLRYALPDYRLPPEALDQDLKVFDKLDVQFKTGIKVGRDISLSQLADDFQAVGIGTGASRSKANAIEGVGLEGVLLGLDFLRSAKDLTRTSIPGRVLVIGGGNVAIDVARTAVRLGAGEVVLACLECDSEMPAHDWEVEEAKEEDVNIHTSWGPKRILGEGKVRGMELVKCTSVFNKRGEFAPEFDDSVTKIIETDTIILAIGQEADPGFAEGLGTSRGYITTSEDTLTSIPKTFAGGEGVRGPASVVECVADGTRMASAIDCSLGGTGDIGRFFGEKVALNPCIDAIEDFASLGRVPVAMTGAEDRKTDFNIINRGYKDEGAKNEALRCLRCDLRLDILAVTLPPDMWLELTQENVDLVPTIEGVFQLLDEDKKIIVIKGSMDLKADLGAKLGSGTKAKFFGFEEDPMYSKRESELIQKHLQEFGQMPKGDGEGDDLDDLF